MPKENADALKAKYNLTDETIQDVVSNLKATGTPKASEQEEEEPLKNQSEPEIFAKIGKGETSMGDALVWIDFQDRREARRTRAQNNTTPEQIAKAVTEGIKEAFGSKPRTEDEIPQWAKPLYDDIKEIKNREQKKEEDARLQETVQNAVKPVQQELEKTKEQLAKIQTPPEKQAKGELETTKDTLKTLQELDELRGKPKMPEKAKEVMIDLNEEVATALGDEIKKAIVESVHERLSGGKEEGTPPVTITSDGKVQMDWYNLGQRILKTVDKFIEKLPVAAPGKVAVKEMPPPSKPPQLPTPPSATTPTPPTSTTQTPPIAPPTQTPPTPPPLASATTEVQVTPPPPPPRPEVPASPPATQEVATAKQEEKPTPQESKPEEPQPQEEPHPQSVEQEPKPDIESEEETAERIKKLQPPPEQSTTKVKPPQLPKKNEEQKEEAEKTEKTIIAESTTKESVVEQETSKHGGSEETLHGGSVTEKGRGEPTKSN